MEWGRILVQRPPLELKADIITFLIGRVDGRNASSFTSTGALEGMGIKVQPLDFTRSQVVSKLKGWLALGAVAQRPLFFLVASHKGREIRSFHQQLKKILPPVGILITPSEIVEARANNPLRAQHFWIDSSAVGDVLGGCWGAFLCTRKPMVLSTVWYATGTTLATKYEEMGDGAEPDPTGTLQRYAIPYSAGAVQEIATLDQDRSLWY